MEINFDKINRLVKDGYISQREHPDGELFIYNYTQKAQYESHWCKETLMCRGLILDAKGNVIARAFDKIFNWFEGGRISKSSIKTITEKFDGSLGICFKHNGRVQFATRGSFTSEQARWAMQYWHSFFGSDDSMIPLGTTLLFEIIYPDNRIVIDYEGQEDLVLLAIRHNDTGEYFDYFPNLVKFAHHIGLTLVPFRSFNNPEAILSDAGGLPPNKEGYVAQFTDGSWFKFKGDEYVTLHRLISTLSYKNTLIAIQKNGLEEFLANIPDEFHREVKGWASEIETRVNDIRSFVIGVYQGYDFDMSMPEKRQRKKFAAWAMDEWRHISGYLFALLDGKDIEDMIYRQVSEAHKEERVVA